MRINLSSSSGNAFVGKLVMTGFGLFFAFIGSQFVKQEWRNLHEVKAMQEWSRTTCTIVRSEVKDDGEDFRLEIAYTYRVGDQTFNGDRYSRSHLLTAETIGEIKEAETRFREGVETACYFDPDDPGSSVLNLPTVKGARASIGFAMMFPAFGLFFASLPWVGRKRKRNKTQKTPAGESAKSSGWFLVIFGLVFAIFGIVMIKPFLITPMLKTRDAQNWNAVKATVVSSKVKSHSDDDGTTYSVYIAYRYEVDGNEYYGDRYTFMGGSSSGYDAKAETVRNYPKDHEFTVFVNPGNPSESVIRREYSLSLLFGLIPLAFSIIGIAIIYFGVRNKKPALDMAQSHQHIVELKYPSPAKKAVGLTVFTCFWLGVVYFLSRSEAPLIFPIVFGFFGLLLVFGSAQAFLKIFTPRPRVELTPGNMHPGTSIAMRWRIDGRTDRIEALSIRIQCLKVVTETHRSGGKTSTSVVKKPLFDHELHRTGSQFEIAQGTLQFTLPGDYPATRPGNYNGIQWQIAFHGTIQQWPDMTCEMPFTVYPQG